MWTYLTGQYAYYSDAEAMEMWQNVNVFLEEIRPPLFDAQLSRPVREGADPFGNSAVPGVAVGCDVGPARRHGDLTVLQGALTSYGGLYGGRYTGSGEPKRW